MTIVLYLSKGATHCSGAACSFAAVSRSGESAVARHGIVCRAVPLFHAGAGYFSGLKLSSVRLAVSTTYRLPEAKVAVSFQGRFGVALSQALGVIELGLVCANVDDPVGRRDSVGRPLSNFAVNIRNADSEGYGEVVVSGPGILDAYINPWVSRDELMPDGWFATGDIGAHRCRRLFVSGRAQGGGDQSPAGRKVFPEEIYRERPVNRHPSVSESRVYRGAAASAPRGSGGSGSGFAGMRFRWRRSGIFC